MGKLIGAMYHKLSAEDMATWKAKAEEDKARYETEIAEFRATHGETQADRKAKERAEAKSNKPRPPKASSVQSDEAVERKKAAKLEAIRKELEEAVAAETVLQAKKAKNDKKLEKCRLKREEHAADEEMLKQIDLYEAPLKADAKQLASELAEASERKRSLAEKHHAAESRAAAPKRRAEESSEGAAPKAPKAPKADKAYKPEKAAKGDKADKAAKAEAKAEKVKVGKADRAELKGEIAELAAEAAGNGEAELPSDRPKPKRLKKLSDAAEPTADAEPPRRELRAEPPRDETPRATNGSTPVTLQELTQLAEELQAASEEATADSVLSRLRGLAMTLELLQETKIGKIANKVHKTHPGLKSKALALVDTWKALATTST